MSEFSFLDDLLPRLHAPGDSVVIPPGDDCAELKTGGQTLLAADMLLDGVHFDAAALGYELVGRKALAVNLSDVAAMAGTPTACVVSLALPRVGGRRIGEQVMAGLVALAASTGVVVAGGDTNSWDGPLVVNVAILGAPHPRGSVRRSGARPGDAILVTGPLGGSIHGRHARFQPRLAAAQLLHERYGVSAMLDLSDGLAADLRHILRASGVGAVLAWDAIPIHADTWRHADGHLAAARLAHALSDGEDFELCLTMSPEAAAQLLAAQPCAPEVVLTQIGRITETPDALVWQDGTVITAGGYAHALA